MDDSSTHDCDHRTSRTVDAEAAAVVDWAISDHPVAYAAALAAMEARIAAIASGEAPELVWLLEHPPLYTAGTSAKPKTCCSLIASPCIRPDEAGNIHIMDPGQRIAYVMLDLRTRGRDVRGFIGMLEAWIIETLAAFNVRGEVREDRVGVWVRRPERAPDAEDKIAAIGLRLRQWVSFHGISLNVEPDLEHFSGIVPCGVSRHGVTSLADLGLTATMDDADLALEAAFRRTIAPVRRVAPPVST